jgi:hypothetical protein
VSDKLVERLRAQPMRSSTALELILPAADRIEALEQALREAEWTLSMIMMATDEDDTCVNAGRALDSLRAILTPLVAPERQ